MKRTKSIIVTVMVVAVIMVFFVVAQWQQKEMQGEGVNNTNLASERESIAMEEDDSESIMSLNEPLESELGDDHGGGDELAMEETEFFGYFYGMEYDEEKLPRRFGYVVEEGLADYLLEKEGIERAVDLSENNFTHLKKGQYFHSGIAESEGSEYSGIDQIIGAWDGLIMVTPRQPGTALARTIPYYKINENTYIMLFFGRHNVLSLPLERIEVWDAEGNKLRELELEATSDFSPVFPAETPQIRFGHTVEEYDVIRTRSLKEDDFKQLKKGQYATTDLARKNDSRLQGVIEMIGEVDGQILYTQYVDDDWLSRINPYYRIDEDTYVVLIFEYDKMYARPLDHIEVWDAEGNKLREIEID